MNFNYIDTDAYEQSGIETFFFPGGEPHCNVPKWPMGHTHIFAKLRTWEDAGRLRVVMDALNHQSVKIYLFAPYLPGARQDRNPEGLTPLTGEMYARSIFDMAEHITAVDVHSANALMQYNSWVDTTDMGTGLYLKELVTQGRNDMAPDAIVCPDEGAKVRALAASDLLQYPVIYATKKRDFQTGKLSGFEVPDTFQVGYRYLIVDDICDGGGTFLGLAEAILAKEHNVLLDLYVTHGIFSNGALDKLKGYFTHIYTTNSFYRPNTKDFPFVHSVDLLPYYFGGLRP